MVNNFRKFAVTEIKLHVRGESEEGDKYINKILIRKNTILEK